MLKKIINIIIIVLVISFLAGITSAEENLPNFPMSLYGSLKIGGSPAPVGTVVSAKAGAHEVGSIETDTLGNYGDKPNGRLSASANADGDLIDIYVNTVKVKTIPYNLTAATLGELIKIDLDASVEAGKRPSSSGHGSGDSGRIIKPTPTVTQAPVEGMPIESQPGAEVKGTPASSVPVHEPSLLRTNWWLIAVVFIIIIGAVILYTLKTRSKLK